MVSKTYTHGNMETMETNKNQSLRNLIKLGIAQAYKAWEFANTRKGYWNTSR